jgi:drug/metabolite transporter (DMT)-like permease
MALFSIEAAFARAIGPDLNLGQIGTIRAVVQLLMLWAWLGRGFPQAIATARPGMHMTRGLLSVTGLAAYFYVFANMPMTTATVLVFAGVLFTTIGAQAILGEAVGWRRWAATAVGFAGVLVVVRPAATALDWTLAIGLYLAANGAAINIATKGLTKTEPTQTIMIWISLTMLVAALPLAVLTFTVPTPRDALLMLSIGVAGTLGQYASVTAYRLADVSAVAPIMYLRIVIAAAVGVLIFGETLDGLTILGATIVTASALYITIREAKLARQREPL